jgi:predicted DNA-binding protein with PD1-like motif
MRYVKDGDNFLISIEKNDDVIESILSVVKKGNLHSASISGIGAVKDVTLGIYNTSEKKYDQKHFPVIMSWSHAWVMYQKKMIRCLFTHTLLMNGPDYRTIGGHLFSAKIAAVGEFVLQPFNTKIVREMNDDVGLAAWNLSEEDA